VNLLQKITEADLSTIKFYWVTRGKLCGLNNILMGRTGYTAEDGFEILCSRRRSKLARACGMRFWLRARNSASCLAAWDRATRCDSKASSALTATRFQIPINVWEAGLDRFCKMEKPEFVGRAALEKAKAAGRKRILVGLEMTERGIARDGYKVLDTAGAKLDTSRADRPRRS